MIFTLEALQAHKGDALLLHYGDPAAPSLVVIDGGPNRTWEGLRARLDSLLEGSRPLTAEGKLPIRLVMISHIDDDHIHGILEMTDAMLGRRKEEPPAYDVTAFWHNAFDDVIGRAAAASTASVAGVQGASVEELPAKLPVKHQAQLVLQSVNQGRRLRDNITALGREGNLPFGGLVAQDHPENPVDMDAGLTFTIVGPAQAEIDALETDWDEHLKKKQAKAGEPQSMESVVADYLDESSYNLSSIVVMAEMDGKRMLLTGDARGDHVLLGLETRKYLEPGGTMKVDVLKLPHHGSERNVHPDFFRRVLADHYVVSADGEHGNPDVPTLQMLTEVRGDAEYTIYLTNRVPAVVEFLERDQPERSYRVVYREDGELSVRVELGDPLPD
ncbi:MAG TPA: hypothetical protein VFQ76_13630 [Longimicrobiaceae bacterium]|nr:hypothetical protein [Longimicrobiaceae bacterium]